MLVIKADTFVMFFNGSFSNIFLFSKFCAKSAWLLVNSLLIVYSEGLKEIFFQIYVFDAYEFGFLFFPLFPLFLFIFLLQAMRMRSVFFKVI